MRAALRLARYSLARCGAVLGLMNRLASVPESFEMARATGLTLNQVSWCLSTRKDGEHWALCAAAIIHMHSHLWLTPHDTMLYATI